MVGLLHSTVSPDHMNVPLVAGVVDQLTANLLTVELAGVATIA